jgi:hypothetical protein
MKPRYIAHTGNKHPVTNISIVAVKFRDGTMSSNNYAGYWAGTDTQSNWWLHSADTKSGRDIIAYRVIEQE